MAGKQEIRKAADALKDVRGTVDGGLRVVITGKGGVGKTTITALLAHLLARAGERVLAVDADPQENLAYALGCPESDVIVPLSENASYIEEKVGARPGGWGGMLTLNPDVDDAVDRFGIRFSDRLTLLVMGTVGRAGSGCLCPENALLGGLVRSIALGDGDAVLLDTQAGVEHFGRALAHGFSDAVVVADPSYNAISVARHAAELADGLGIPAVHLVVNRVRDNIERERAERLIGSAVCFTSVVWLPYDDSVRLTEPDVSSLLGGDSAFLRGVRDLSVRLRDHRCE
ncbi:ATP-binding protein [Methanofollis fontis]|uniref:Carbon monoxide dehydrogenase n=1 Tax=Methanofollis fontis TaxID=2052832 RepID=A0A483CUD5_9EURY|nr:AAA family ATPase [Methanofollis fontis]TAJ44924.1 carbon monoxide dehydrogenase [Methanofollis fontis]